jgi:SnoaL-like protein
MSSEQDNKAIVRNYFEDAFNRGYLDVADEIFDPEHQILNPYISEEMRGPAPMKDLVWFSRKMLPDLEVVVEDDIAEGEKVTTRWTLRGNLADKLRTPDVDEEVRVSGISVSRVIGGKIKETRLRCEAVKEPQRPVPRDEFREWLREATPTMEREASHLTFPPLDNSPVSRFCCIFGLKFCCYESEPRFTE